MRATMENESNTESSELLPKVLLSREHSSSIAEPLSESNTILNIKKTAQRSIKSEKDLDQDKGILVDNDSDSIYKLGRQSQNIFNNRACI